MEAPNPAQTYLVEAADLLDQVEDIVLEVEKHPEDREAVNRLFRAFHTIKGSGAMFGFDAVAAFTHHVESALDRVRQGKQAISPALVQSILAARDHIQQLLAAAPDDLGALQVAGNEIVAGLTDQTNQAPTTAAVAPSAPASIPVERSEAATYRIHFRPNPSLPATGLDPAALLDEVRGLGPCVIACDVTQVPPLGAADPTKCYLTWEIVLTTDRGLNAIKDVFIFAEDGSDLKIEAVPPRPEIPLRARSTPVGQPPVVAPAAPKPAEAEPTASAGANAIRSIREGVVRVPSTKLDHIVGLVGELVMNQSRLLQVSDRLNVAELAGPVEAIERLIAELRDSVLGIRMMPIGSTFSRFKRLVHDLSRDLGKDVELVTEGADTELDKTVLDQLADPLVHLIRNSIDHGIGTPQERIASGKPPRGLVRLAASHEGSHVVVTIEDDGRGLDQAAIRAKAVEKGLIAKDAELTESEIFNLIFLPGFSTAKNVTAVSGRGVGMDVVRKQIDALRGGIQLASVPGRSTTISLALPLTLAIIDGLLVTIAGDPFIIPMSVVMENVELRREERTRNNGRNLVTVRGELIPYLHLREMFGIEGEEPEIEKIVIARYGRDRVGLVVDRVLGSHQTVIQSLGRMFKSIGVVSGGTILGDGRVALILDLSGLVGFAEKQRTSELVRQSGTTAAA
jgi:two-component system chemotaxis sensor kinase CheA